MSTYIRTVFNNINQSAENAILKASNENKASEVNRLVKEGPNYGLENYESKLANVMPGTNMTHSLRTKANNMLAEEASLVPKGSEEYLKINKALTDSLAIQKQIKAISERDIYNCTTDSYFRE